MGECQHGKLRHADERGLGATHHLTTSARPRTRIWSMGFLPARRALREWAEQSAPAIAVLPSKLYFFFSAPLRPGR